MQDNAIRDIATDDTTTAPAAPQPGPDDGAVVAAYLATWNASDPRELRALLEAHWSQDVTYTDPLAEVRGHDGVAALVAGVQAQFPGFVFTVVGEPNGHHRQVRFQWGLGPEGSEPVVIGSDVVVLDADGRVLDVRGFLDVVPEVAA